MNYSLLVLGKKKPSSEVNAADFFDDDWLNFVLSL